MNYSVHSGEMIEDNASYPYVKLVRMIFIFS